MAFTLEYFPVSGGASVKDTFAGWGILNRWSGFFRSAMPDELNLTIGKRRAAALDSFEPRSRIIIRDGDDNIFFQGIVPDADRAGDPSTSTLSLQILGPWWYLEGLPFVRIVHTDYWTGGAVNVGDHVVFDTEDGALNLNRTPDGTYMKTRAMLIEILNYAISKGANFQYIAGEIADLAVLPQPFKNGTCANAIRAELADVDTAVWFDHTTEPPTLHIKQRSECVSISRTLGEAHQVQAFNLRRLDTLRVPYVQLTFESALDLNGISYPNHVTYVYPDPRPAGTVNNFYPFVETIPLDPLVASTLSANVFTEDLNPTDVEWWKRQRPELADTTQYKDITIDVSSVIFDPLVNSPRMLTKNKGGYATWMGGIIEKTKVTAKFTYNRPLALNLPGSKFREHVFTAEIMATTLDAPNGVTLSSPPTFSGGENPGDYATLAQTLYESLNTPCYDGIVKCVETGTEGWVGIGNTLNLLGDVKICRAEWNTMNALVQEVEFDTHGGNQFFINVHVGANKLLTPDQLRNRVLAKRLTLPSLNVSYSGGALRTPAGSQLPDTRADNTPTQGPPLLQEQYIASAPAQDGSRFIVRVSSDGQSGAGLANAPLVEIKKIDALGVTVPNTPRIALSLADMAPVLGSNAFMRDWGGGTYVLSTGVVPAYFSTWDATVKYKAGAIVRFLQGPNPGVYGARADNQNVMPVWPEVANNPWELIAFTPKVQNACANGQGQRYVNASDVF